MRAPNPRPIFYTWVKLPLVVMTLVRVLLHRLGNDLWSSVFVSGGGVEELDRLVTRNAPSKGVGTESANRMDSGVHTF